MNRKEGWEDLKNVLAPSLNNNDNSHCKHHHINNNHENKKNNSVDDTKYSYEGCMKKS